MQQMKEGDEESVVRYYKDRDDLNNFSTKLGRAGIERYHRRKNTNSLDGLPALRWTKHPVLRRLRVYEVRAWLERELGGLRGFLLGIVMGIVVVLVTIEPRATVANQTVLGMTTKPLVYSQQYCEAVTGGVHPQKRPARGNESQRALRAFVLLCLEGEDHAEQPL
ncbi:MAG: hypothetical protein Q9159_007644 [Coniocarpon cinnabarinum]